MNSIRRDLPVHFAYQPIRSSALPTAGLHGSLEHSTGNEKSGSLANQVRIGTAEQRGEAIDMVNLGKKRSSDTCRAGIGQGFRWKQQEDCPDPGNGADGNFEAGLPV